MRGATWTRKLRSAATGGAVLAGAGAATALGWSGWVETESVTGATNAQPPALPAAGALTTGRPALRQAAVLVCQATGDGDYVVVRVLTDRLDEYRRNPNNIVPAPTDGCPSSVRSGEGSIPTTTAPPTQPSATTSTPTTPPPRATPTTTTPRTAPPTTASRRTPATSQAAPTSEAHQPEPPAGTSAASSATPPSSGAASPSTASGGSVPRRTRTYTGKLPANLKRLPNTGDETSLLLFFGADLLLLGAGLRLRTRRRS